jgi:signal transduction histidine kinase
MSVEGLSPVAVPSSFGVKLSSAFSGRRWVLAGLWLTAAAAQLGALRPLITGQHADPAVILYHVLGGSFAACGLLAWYRRPDGRTGRLMVVTGFLFFLRPLLSELDWSLAQTVGMALGNLWVITFVALLVAFPSRPRRWALSERLLIGVFVLAEIVLVLAWMLFTPFPGNLLLVSANSGAEQALNGATGVIGFAAGLSVAVLLAGRWLAATPGVRRASAPAVAGGATLVFLSGLLLQGAFTTSQSPFLVWPTLVGLLLVPVVFLGGIWRAWAARAAVADLLVELGAARGGPLQTALAKALRDPTLTLAYWLLEFGRWVDVQGRPIDLPEADSGRVTKLIERDGAPVAALLHDRSLADEPALLDAVTAAAAIALENERLQAELRARLEELRGSRQRVIEAGQDERQRLERDLHDGAQQRLIALSLELGRLGNRLDDRPDARSRLDRARQEVAMSLEELRAVARGIHPAVVSGHGLGVALESLAARAPVPVRLLVELEARMPEPLEVAAYYVVSESLANIAKHACATSASVDVTRENGELVVEVVDDGVGGADTERGTGLRGLADRVEALGGRVRIWTPLGGGTRVRAEMPCG